MATPAEASQAQVKRDGDALVFAGAVVRGSIARLWPQAQASRGGARRIDLTAVSRIDSAGLALLAELAGDGVLIEGNPPGLAELRGAYRLDATLGFAS